MHAATPLTNHIYKQGIPVSATICIPPVDNLQEVFYVHHLSTLRDTTFVHSKLEDQTHCRNILVLTLILVADVPNLCLVPVRLVPQEGQSLRITCYYSYSCINAAVYLQAPPMPFNLGDLAVPPKTNPFKPCIQPRFLSKTNLSDVYMRIWIRPDDIPFLTLLELSHPSNTNPILSFNFYLHVQYI